MSYELPCGCIFASLDACTIALLVFFSVFVSSFFLDLNFYIALC